MKKLSLILICFLICGCQSKISDSQKQYNQIIEKLNDVTTATENIPFDVSVELYDLDSEIMYNLIIEKPTEDINNVSALVIHNVETNDVFPSVGIFDESISLNQSNKGLVLVGYIPKQNNLIEFKVYIRYTYQNKEYISYRIISTKLEK